MSEEKPSVPTKLEPKKPDFEKVNSEIVKAAIEAVEAMRVGDLELAIAVLQFVIAKGEGRV